MNDLNSYIDTARKFTAPPDGIPLTDHSQQIQLATGLNQHAAQQAQVPIEPPKTMVPIVPVAN